MLYTFSQFNKQFPDEDTCLEYMFNIRFNGFKCPKCGKTNFYRVKGRKAFACSCSYQVNPTAHTIFHKSDTNLKDWFFAIYLYSNSKNGVSAKELQRHLGTTYKTAWRIANKIRSLMKQDGKMLGGVVEADETYIGGKGHRKGLGDKIPVMGMVQRGGKVISKKIEAPQTHILLGELQKNVKFGSRLITDDHTSYRKAMRLGFRHDIINHSKHKFAKGDIYTNTIEGFWSQMKRSIDGTYHSVSSKHLQSYVDEFSYYYNQRFAGVSAFHDLLYRLCDKPYSRGQRIGIFQGVKVSS